MIPPGGEIIVITSPKECTPMDEDTRNKLIEIIRILPEDKIPPLIDFLNFLVNDYQDDDGSGDDREDELLMN
jgi:hypothetical protein